jgi:hypothetical protein
MRLSAVRRAAADAPRWRYALTRDPRRLLESADRLVAERRAVEALEVLNRANRRSPNTEVASRIADVRYHAFHQTQWETKRPSWPEQVPDLFPGAQIPEVPRDELTAECLRSALMHHGFLLVRDFAGGADIERLIRDIENAFSACATPRDGAHDSELAGWFRPYPYDHVSNRSQKVLSGCVLAVDSPPAMFDVIEVFERAGVRTLAREFFGEAPAALAKKWSLRRVRHDSNTGDWHQDGAFMGEDIRSLNVWLTLSHCGDTAPGIDIVGRRVDRVLECGTEGAYFPWSIGPPVAERAAAGSIVRPIFEAGDALLFDHLCVHRTAVDPGMTRDRYAIEAWFLAPSTYEAMLGRVEHGYSPRDQIPIFY